MHRGSFPAFLLLLASCGSPRLVNATVDTDPKPTCPPPDACHAAEFDQADNECIAYPVADGTLCSAADQCLEGASCIAGVCLGQTRSCDDGNICTQDSCDPAQGCVHARTTAACPAPPDACHVATCDPGSGCGVADAPDWTPCGAMSCTEAHVCFSGSCLAVTPPDGMRCGEPAPCSGAPTCQSGVCVQPMDGGTIPVLWSYKPPANYTIYSYSEGASDARGNSFWIEEPQSIGVPGGHALIDGMHAFLVSVDANGRLRFRVPAHLLDAPGFPKPQLEVAGGVLIASVSTDDDGRGGFAGVLGFSADDGGMLWSSNFAEVLEADAGVQRVILSPVYDGASTVYVPVNLREWIVGGPRGVSAWLIAVDLRTGLATVGPEIKLTGVPAQIIDLVRDREGDMFVRVAGSDGIWGGVYRDELRRYRWPSSSFDLVAEREGPDAVDGASLVTGTVTDTWNSYPPKIRSTDGGLIAVVQGDAGVASGWAHLSLAGESGFATQAPAHDPSASLVEFSVRSGAVEWRRPIRGAFLDGPFLTSRGSLLSITGPDPTVGESSDQLQIIETLSDGGAGFSCKLDAAIFGLHVAFPIPGVARTIVRANRCIIAGEWGDLVIDGGGVIAAFALPGYDIADGGWVAPGGNMERNGYVP